MNRFIVAESNKCIGCRTCEVACVVSHQASQDCSTVSPEAFLPRIRVVKTGMLSTAAVCRQCEDAPCGAVCPTHAISRTGDFIAVDQARCIGCKTCMLACPYGAMEVVTAGVNQAQALKCDLCFHRETGPACVEACPTSALRCMDPLQLEQISAEKRRRAAAWETVMRSLPARRARSLRPEFSLPPQFFPAPAHSSCAYTDAYAATAYRDQGRNSRQAPSVRPAF